MSGPPTPVLLDNCAVSACFEVGAWKALSGHYNLETVEEVAQEAATGAANREIIDPREFALQVKVHAVSRRERLARQAEFEDLGRLDAGERDLWVHALDRDDSWILCGPDTASIRFGVRAGHAEKLVSLETLVKRMGYTLKTPLKHHFTDAWLKAKIGEYVLELTFEKLKKKP